MAIDRPGTLAEAVSRVAAGADTFGRAISEFLDEFYLDGTPGERLTRIVDEPAFLGNARNDAYVGAIGEHLSRRWGLGLVPEWTDDPRRFLDMPYFLGGRHMQPILLMESPLAFRKRFIFTEGEPLRRARMPQDGRWWAWESLRTGITETTEQPPSPAP